MCRLFCKKLKLQSYVSFSLWKYLFSVVFTLNYVCSLANYLKQVDLNALKLAVYFICEFLESRKTAQKLPHTANRLESSNQKVQWNLYS